MALSNSRKNVRLLSHVLAMTFCFDNSNINMRKCSICNNCVESWLHLTFKICPLKILKKYISHLIFKKSFNKRLQCMLFQIAVHTALKTIINAYLPLLQLFLLVVIMAINILGFISLLGWMEF